MQGDSNGFLCRNFRFFRLFPAMSRVSKTGGWGFESLLSCQQNPGRHDRRDQERSVLYLSNRFKRSRYADPFHLFERAATPSSTQFAEAAGARLCHTPVIHRA
jgi:hypothetical protein